MQLSKYLIGGLFGIVLGFTGCSRSEVAEDRVDSSNVDQVMIFAAASTTNAIQEIGALYTEATGVPVVTSFASSSTLAKQIEQGAPADVFLSANPKWMDYLETANRVQAGTREDLLVNRIVLIAPSDSAVETVEISDGLDLASMFGANGRLGMGDPAHVPAGIYGKQALETLHLWSGVSNRIAAMSDVRAALAIVERGEVPFGVVYATDAALSGRVKVVGVFPASAHSPVVYPVGVVSEQLSMAKSFIDFLKTEDAQAVFTKYGFGRP